MRYTNWRPFFLHNLFSGFSPVPSDIGVNSSFLFRDFAQVKQSVFVSNLTVSERWSRDGPGKDSTPSTSALSSPLPVGGSFATCCKLVELVYDALHILWYLIVAVWFKMSSYIGDSLTNTSSRRFSAASRIDFRPGTVGFFTTGLSFDSGTNRLVQIAHRSSWTERLFFSGGSSLPSIFHAPEKMTAVHMNWRNTNAESHGLASCEENGFLMQCCYLS